MNNHKPNSDFRLQLSLLFVLVRREILKRYRGSVLGILWSLLTPLFMLAIYTFVFGIIMKARWGVESSDQGVGQYSVILFGGLIIFQLFAEVIVSASTLVAANTNLVKKTVFPLHILVLVILGAALFHFIVSAIILTAFIFLVMGTVPATIVLLPIVMLPFLLVTIGIGWIIASLGVFIRDISQILGTLMTALLFLSPVFFPVDRLPDWARTLIWFNPISVPVEQLRQVMIWGVIPGPANFLIYSLASMFVGIFGYWWFKKTSIGFADVI